MHLVVTTNSGAHIPGVDFRLVPLLGLSPAGRAPHHACSMLYLNGCFAGAAALRLASRDLAENSRGARVLVVCAEITVLLLLFTSPRTPSPCTSPRAGTAATSPPAGRSQVPVLIYRWHHIGADADAEWKWNDLFLDVHPGSSAILDKVDTVLELRPEKLAASRRVLSEYGNMFGATVIFVLDELRACAAGYWTTRGSQSGGSWSWWRLDPG